MKQYIGDGVYVDIDGSGDLVITTEDGYSTSNTIIMEPEVYDKLTRYMKASTTNDNGRATRGA